jgi:hypothetical protein
MASGSLMMALSMKVTGPIISRTDKGALSMQMEMFILGLLTKEFYMEKES